MTSTTSAAPRSASPIAGALTALASLPARHGQPAPRTAPPENDPVWVAHRIRNMLSGTYITLRPTPHVLRAAADAIDSGEFSVQVDDVYLRITRRTIARPGPGLAATAIPPLVRFGPGGDFTHDIPAGPRVVAPDNAAQHAATKVEIATEKAAYRCDACGDALARMAANAAPTCPNGCSGGEHFHDREHRLDNEDAAAELADAKAAREAI